MERMDFKAYWHSLTRPQRDAVIARAATSEGYIDKLCGGHCYPSLPKAAGILAACRSVKCDDRLGYESFLIARSRRLAR